MFRRRVAALLAMVLICTGALARNYKVYGPQGGLAMDVTLPEKFDTKTDRCPMVILMHGIFSSKDFAPLPDIARALAKQGIASIRFDFGGHWKSQGKMIRMTIGKELEDARAMWDYASSLPYVTGISLLGHSQGGVIASMTAGLLAKEGRAPESVVLLAPGSVIKDACRSGSFFGNRFDPSDPPEFIRCFKIFRVGREYMLTSQDLEIYETSALYRGPVCLIHGDHDTTVPLRCSRQYDQIYEDSVLNIIEGENHRMSAHKDQVVKTAVDFIRSKVKL